MCFQEEVAIDLLINTFTAQKLTVTLVNATSLRYFYEQKYLAVELLSFQDVYQTY